MADCEYQIEGSDKIYSESEFKKLLSEGYLDKVMMDKGIKIKGIKADEALASSFQLPSAIQPQVQPTAEVTETVTPTAEVTETVTPEIKTEEVVTPTETKVEEKSFDDRVAEEYAKKLNTYKDNPKETISRQKSEIENLNKFKNKEITAKEYLENTSLAYAMSSPLSTAPNEEIELAANNLSDGYDKELNQARQKVQSETVTETEEVVTEPTAETKQPTREAVAAKNLADFLRRGKSEKGTLMASPLPGFNQVWDATIETVAKAIEVGGVTAGNFRKSINDGMKALKNTDAYKAITDIRERDRITSEYRKLLLEKIPQFFNVDPTEDFGNVWDSSTEIVDNSLSKSDKSPEALQKAIDEGFKEVKKSTWYNSLGKEQKQQFAADYNEAMNRMFPIKKEKATKETVSQEEKEKGKEFKGKVSEATGTAKPEKTIRLSESELLRMQIKYGNLAGKETIKNLQRIKEQIREYAKENLPKDDYSAKEVNSLMRTISAAKTEKGLEKALDKIDALVARKLEKQAAKDRISLIKDIESKIAANSKKVISKNRRTGAKKGKITIESQQQINQVIQDLKDKGLFKNLDKLSTDELIDLNNEIDNIIETGRANQKQLNSIEEANKRTDKAMILESLSKRPDEYLNGEEEITESLEEKSGVVIVDGQAMNKQAFEKYKNENPDAELNDVPFYYRRDAKEVKEELKQEKTFRKGVRNITLFTVRDLETYIKKLGSGSKELKTWLEDNIGKPIREGRRKAVETVWNKTKEYQKSTREIFGTDSLGRSNMYDALVTPTDIKPKNSKNVLSAGQVVHLYGVLNNTDKDKAEANAKRLQKYNGISAKEVIDFMENPDNKVLMDYYNFLKDKYNGEFRDEFGPSIEQLHNIALEDKYYYPEPASGAATEAENILDLEGGTKSLSAIAPNMRHRKDAVSVPFELVDAHEMFLRYINSMAHAKEFIPVTKAAYTLLSDMNKPYIMEKFGSITEYNDFIKALGIAITDKSSFQNDPFTNLNNWTALTLLWFRIKAIPQQASAFAHYYTAGLKDGIMPWDVVRGHPVSNNDFKFFKDFYFDNPYLYTRLSGGNITPEMQALKNQIDSNLNKYKKGILNTVQFVGLLPIKGGDAVASASPGAGASFALAEFRKKFNETKDYKLSRDFAIQRWMEETERTQQPSIAKEAISTATYNNIVRLMIPFSSAQNAIAKKAYKAYLDIKDWKNLDNNEKIQSVSDLIYYPILANVPFIFTGGAGMALYRMLNDDEEDEKLEDAQKKRIYYDIVMDNIQANATAAGGLGIFLNSYLNIARGKEYFNEKPIFARTQDIVKIAIALSLEEKDFSEMPKEQRLKFYEKHIDPNDPLGKREFNNMEEYQEWEDKVYNAAPFYEKLSEKEIKLLKSASGLKNVFTFAEDISDAINGDKTFAEFMGTTEQKRNEANKDLDPYFNQAKKFNKKDLLWNKFSDQEYLIEKIDEDEANYVPFNIRRSIRKARPKRPTIKRPR
jgi:hypothetical protein